MFFLLLIEMKRKRQQGKHRKSKKPKNSSSNPSEIIIKNFEIFVTDFLTDPCGLPLELKDCVLVDGTKPAHEHSGTYLPIDSSSSNEFIFLCISDTFSSSSSSNNSEMLKKLFNHSSPIDGENDFFLQIP